MEPTSSKCARSFPNDCGFNALQVGTRMSAMFWIAADLMPRRAATSSSGLQAADFWIGGVETAVREAQAQPSQVIRRFPMSWMTGQPGAVSAPLNRRLPETRARKVRTCSHLRAAG